MRFPFQMRGKARPHVVGPGRGLAIPSIQTSVRSGRQPQLSVAGAANGDR